MVNSIRPALLVAGVALAAAIGASHAAPVQTPAAAASELLAADQGFSRRGASLGLVPSLSAMFADDIVMPTPQGVFAHGKTEAIAAISANALNVSSTVTWEPIRVGVSADGLHGFTIGAMVIVRADGTVVPAKYLAYWVKRSGEWRVVAYKRSGRAQGAVTPARMEPSLPPESTRPIDDAATLVALRTSLMAAERAFSDLAQRIGLGPAFRATGQVDAMNLGSSASPGFVVGNDAIAAFVQGEAPPSDVRVHWSADTAIVASSGDLGVTIGFIKENVPSAGSPATGFPFFTIWRRARPDAAWKYIAE